MQYIYPKIPVPAVSTLVIKNNKILSVLRGNPPSENIWSLPGGKIELGETILDAAKREVLEETNIVISPIMPFTAVDAIYHDEMDKIIFHYVIVYVYARYINGEINPGGDVLDVRWVSIEELNSIKFEKKTRDIIKDIFESKKIPIHH